METFFHSCKIKEKTYRRYLRMSLIETICLDQIIPRDAVVQEHRVTRRSGCFSGLACCLALRPGSVWT